MRTIIVFCLVLMIAFSFGCSKKKEDASKENALKTEENQGTGEGGRVATTLDPVSKEEVDMATTPYSFEFNGMLYCFSSAENMEAFKANPAKYLGPDEIPPASPPQGQ